jgi:aryl carrier-like protein
VSSEAGQSGPSLTIEEFVSEVRTIVRDATVGAQSRLLELDIDSVDLMELFAVLEAESPGIEAAELSRCSTVADIYQLLTSSQED